MSLFEWKLSFSMYFTYVGDRPLCSSHYYLTSFDCPVLHSAGKETEGVEGGEIFEATAVYERGKHLLLFMYFLDPHKGD